MSKERTWKYVERGAWILTILVGLLGLFDFLTNKIGFAVPVIGFLWQTLNLRISILIIVVIGIFVWLVLKLMGQKLGERECFLVSFIDEGERSLGLIFKAYKKKFPRDSRTISCCIAAMKKLEKRKVVELGALTGGVNSIQEELFKLTRKGLKKYRKLDPAIKSTADSIFNELTQSPSQRKEEPLVEPHAEAIYILELLANEPGKSMTHRVLEHYFMRQFTPRQKADLQILLTKLESHNLIGEIEIGEMDELGYEISRQGLLYLDRHRKSIGRV